MDARPPYTFKRFPVEYQEKLADIAGRLQMTRGETLCHLIDSYLDQERVMRIPAAGATIDQDGAAPVLLTPHPIADPVSLALRVMELGAIRGNGGVARLARSVVAEALRPHVPQLRRLATEAAGAAAPE